MSSESLYVHCNQCGGETVHASQGQCQKTDSCSLEDGYRISSSTTSKLLECQVCKSAQLQISNWNSENGEEVPLYFPSASKHKPPKWFVDIPNELKGLAKQIYLAMDSGSYSLALMGVRALLDVHVSGKSGMSNGFEKMLNKLVAEGALSADHMKILVPTFDAGSAAAHRGYLPSEFHVITALEVVENLIQQDLLMVKTQKLKADTPVRK
jgi:putative hemolysin